MWEEHYTALEAGVEESFTTEDRASEALRARPILTLAREQYGHVCISIGQRQAISVEWPGKGHSSSNLFGDALPTLNLRTSTDHDPFKTCGRHEPDEALPAFSGHRAANTDRTPQCK